MLNDVLIVLQIQILKIIINFLYNTENNFDALLNYYYFFLIFINVSLLIQATNHIKLDYNIV